MLDLITQDDAANVFRVLFVFKFCGVNTDNNKLVCILVFESFEIGNDMNAVDAAISPEVEQHNFAFQRCERERLISIEPTASADYFRSAHANLFLSRHSKTFRCA